MELIIISVLLIINFHASSFQLGAHLIKDNQKLQMAENYQAHPPTHRYTSNFLMGYNYHNDQK